MPRRLLLGRAGTGKTHACLGLVSRHRRGASLLLVPTYSQAEHLRHLLLDRLPGLQERAVETFETLAERATGWRLRDLVGPAVRDRVAERVLREFFPAAAGQPGFRAEFLAAVKEIKEQGLAPDEALAKAEAHFPPDARGRRLFAAYARYDRELPGPDHEDLLLRARDALTETYELFLVDGFHDFTPVQHQIVERLAARAKKTVVTLPLDPQDPRHPIFATAARTRETLAGYDEEVLGENRRSTGALAALERRLFTTPRGDLAARDIEILACPSEEDEADRLARLVARSGRRFSDFLLVRRSFDGFHALYRAAFDRYGIPLRFFGAEPLGHTPAARAIAIWLRTLCGAVETRSLLPLLRSPFFLARPEPEEVDRITQRLREEGVADAGFEPDHRGPLPDLFRRRFGLRDALIEEPDGSRELAAAARVLAAVQKEADAVADVPLAEAARQVLRRLPDLRGAVPDRRHACVYAVDAGEARQWERPVVCVAGLTSDSFPHQYRQDLFLRDEDRRALGEQQELHLPLRARREDEERYLFYVALTRARERLVLSYPAFDEEGTPRAPSPYLEEMRAQFAGLVPRRIPFVAQQVPVEALVREDLLPIVADGLGRARPGEIALAASLYDLGAVSRAELAWPRRLVLARARPIAALPRDPARRLSASGINDYHRCPYLFLMRRVLRVQPPRERGLDPMLSGGIVHEALERIAREPEDPAAIFDEVFAERTRGLTLGLGDEARRRWLRRVVLREAPEIRRQPVEAVEQEFHVPVGEGVELFGYVDRIDRYAAGQLVRDYKTGHAQLEENVQLDVYLLALDTPAGAVFERLKSHDAVGYVVEGLEGAVRGKVEVVSRAELDERRDRIRAVARRAARAIRAGRLAVDPRDPDNCTRGRCDGYDLCRGVRELVRRRPK